MSEKGPAPRERFRDSQPIAFLLGVFAIAASMLGLRKER
jgi:hypothetical protein